MARINTTDAGEGGGPGFPASHARGLADTGAAVTTARQHPVTARADNAADGLVTMPSNSTSPPEMARRMPSGVQC